MWTQCQLHKTENFSLSVTERECLCRSRCQNQRFQNRTIHVKSRKRLERVLDSSSVKIWNRALLVMNTLAVVSQNKWERGLNVIRETRPVLTLLGWPWDWNQIIDATCKGNLSIMNQSACAPTGVKLSKNGSSEQNPIRTFYLEKH